MQFPVHHPVCNFEKTSGMAQRIGSALGFGLLHQGIDRRFGCGRYGCIFLGFRCLGFADFSIAAFLRFGHFKMLFIGFVQRTRPGAVPAGSCRTVSRYCSDESMAGKNTGVCRPRAQSCKRHGCLRTDSGSTRRGRPLLDTDLLHSTRAFTDRQLCSL